MENVLIDFTRKLFSELRIPTHTVTLPFQWDDQFDLGLRKTLVKDPDNIIKDTFLDFPVVAGISFTVGLMADTKGFTQ